MVIDDTVSLNRSNVTLSRILNIIKCLHSLQNLDENETETQ